MFQIKQGMPSGSLQRGRVVYPLNDLEIGQYFFVPNKTIQQVSSAVTAATRVRKGCTQKKFACRTVIEQGVKGVAVYRIEHPIFDSFEYRENQRILQEEQRRQRWERHLKDQFYEGEPHPGDPGYEQYMGQRPVDL